MESKQIGSDSDSGVGLSLPPRQGTAPGVDSFLSLWEGHLPSGRHGNFLRRWASALGAYGTPLEFVSGVEHQMIRFGDSQQYSGALVCGGNYQLRSSLMSQQTRYAPIGQRADYPAKTDAQCLLCDNVLQGLDSERLPDFSASNVIARAQPGFLVPNRYPQTPGHTLMLPFDHDQKREDLSLSARVPTVAELQTVVLASDAIGFCAFRNHRRDAMSIPDHEHWHLVVRDLLKFTHLSALIGDTARSAELRIRRAEQTPFDTLVIGGGAVTERCCALLDVVRNLERLSVPFTLAYVDGAFLVSPRVGLSDSQHRLRFGAGAPLHIFDTQKPEYLEALYRHIPKVGSFRWGELTSVSER